MTLVWDLMMGFGLMDVWRRRPHDYPRHRNTPPPRRAAISACSREMPMRVIRYHLFIILCVGNTLGKRWDEYPVSLNGSFSPLATFWILFSACLALSPLPCAKLSLAAVNVCCLLASLWTPVLSWYASPWTLLNYSLILWMHCIIRAWALR